MNSGVCEPTVLFDDIRLKDFLPCILTKGYFSPPECQEIIALAQKYYESEATVTSERRLDLKIRKNKVRWMNLSREPDWLWKKLTAVTQVANSYYHYELKGFTEKAQFTDYCELGDHYDWHMDFGAGPLSTRKLSLVVQLSDPADYEGGDLELWTGGGVITALKGLGNVTAFPSFVLHRVLPLLSGRRITLVLWVNGFRPYT